LSIQIPVLDHLGYIVVANRVGIIEIGRRPHDAQHLDVGPRTEAQLINRAL
jgi:hypothetical protein